MRTKYRFNHSKLRGRIKELFGTEGKFAESICMQSNTLSKKLNGLSEFTQNEIIMICEKLDIPVCEIDIYFFVYT